MRKSSLLFSLFVLFFTACDLSTDQIDVKDNELSIIPFSNDNLRYGLVDLNGNIIVNNEWESPSSIAMEGVVSVKNKDGLFEYYTATSNPKRIGAEYQDVSFFSEGLAAVVNEQGFIHYVNKEGNIVFELADDGKGGFIQKSGVFSEGLARFQNSEGLWGFINTNGDIVIKPRYDFVRSFQEGLAFVERYNSTSNERSIGFINKKDEEVIPLTDRYTAISDFSNGLAACTDKNSETQWGYINKEGDRVIGINKLRVKTMPFKDGIAAFYDGSYWGLINETGKIVVNPKYDALLSYYNNGLGPFKNSGNEIGFINSSREEVIKCQFEEVLPFFSNNTVVKDKYYVFIDRDGNSVSDVYLKYIPIGMIVNQYMGYKNRLVKSTYINTNSIANSVITNIAKESVNDLSFNSGVKDVINYYKIPLSKLPQNSYQKNLKYKFDISGNLEPIMLKVTYNESINTTSRNSSNLIINDRAKIEAIEFKIITKGLEEEQINAISETLINKLETAGFEVDPNASQVSWKLNTELYRNERTSVYVTTDSFEIIVKIDFSEYF